MKYFLPFLLVPVAVWGGLKLSENQARTIEPAPVPMVQALSLPAGLQSASLQTFRETPPFRTAAFYGAERSQVASRIDPAADTDTRMALVPRAQELLRLNAVMRDGNTYIAAINGAVVGVGDRIDGFRIIAIESQAVVVEGQRGRERVTFANALAAAQ